MRKLGFSLMGLGALILGACQATPDSTDSNSSPNKKVIAYVHGWNDSWDTQADRVKHITHMNYAFANISSGKVVEGQAQDTQSLKNLVALKAINPSLKLLISVGGWTWSTHFSDIALDEESREIFAQSAVDFMLKHELDGIDLDWEYPGLPGNDNPHRPEDKENFTALLKTIRNKLEALKPNTYLLTIATAASQAYLDHTEMDKVHEVLDFINIMTYDFYTGGSAATGHHANLYASELKPTGMSASKAVEQHLKAGIPVEKLVLGVPFYGRWWKEATTTNNGLYQPATGARGSVSFSSIKEQFTTANGYSTLWDDAAKAPFLWHEGLGQFVTYENALSLSHKLNYIDQKGLGGIMFWQLYGDNGTLLETIAAFEGYP